MPRNPLFLPVYEQSQAAPLRDQIQMALAIADAAILKSLLANCVPAIAPPHLVGALSARISIPIPDGQAVDAVLQFEAIKCVQISPTDGSDDRQHNDVGNRPFARSSESQMAWQSDLKTLVDGVPCSWSRQVLLEAGFAEPQIDAILKLPNDAWHKSWWYALDEDEAFTDRFVRMIRTRRYPNGSVMIQYKDCFQHEQPSCFRSQSQQAIVTVKQERRTFADTLKQINSYRQALDIQRVILICDTISDLEVQGFINQGISLYSMAELVMPMRADCGHCASVDCVMNGREQSPVMVCQNFNPWDQQL